MGNWITRRYCLGCGYLLPRTAQERCPECARAFSLCDAGSWGRKPPRLAVRARLSGAPNAVDAGLVLAASGLTMAAYAVPGCVEPLRMVGLAMGLVVVGLLVVRILTRTGWSPAAERNRATAEVFWFRVGLVLAAFVLTGVLIRARIPVHAAYLINGRGFTNAALAISGGKVSKIQRVSAGVFELAPRGTEYKGWVMVYGVVGDSRNERSYFAYVPSLIESDPLHPIHNDERFRRLAASWYLFDR